MPHRDLPDHCNPSSQYLIDLSSAFHTCVPTELAFVSTLLGVCSIISWLFAQMPQIYKNYKLKSASGLSVYFLVEWLLGDLTNLLGALLTHQASWQVVVATYYVFVDLCLMAQYIWYTHLKDWKKRRRLERHMDGNTDEGGRSPHDLLIGLSPSDSAVLSTSLQAKDNTKTTGSHPPQKPSNLSDGRQYSAIFSPSFDEKLSQSRPTQKIILPPPTPALNSASRNLLLLSLLTLVVTNAAILPAQSGNRPRSSYLPSSRLHADTIGSTSTSESVGRILSWLSTMLYLLSRLPQIYKNAVRRSTAGLSPSLFTAAFFGNMFYSTSMLTNPSAWDSCGPYGLHGWVGSQGSERSEWLTSAAPFFLGAAGVLGMDGAIGVQFLVYGDGDVEMEMENEREAQGQGERGRGSGRRWKRRVSGWMRGWYPSPSRAAGEGEGASLLGGETDRQEGAERRSGYGAG